MSGPPSTHKIHIVKERLHLAVALFLCIRIFRLFT